jgi:dipeptidase D
MINTIEIFKTITNIPRCSGIYKPFEEFMQEYAKTYDYNIKIDNYHNILCYKKDTKSKLCLQSHYDIVCLEDGKIPEILEQDGYLLAKNSTLGADNGIGCAYMLKLMELDYDMEFLFTSDEEIGLVGASNIDLDIKSTNMLNLDSEEEGTICIGCAGGVDIFGLNPSNSYVQNISNKTLYEIVVDDLPGGHSGVDIDKNITNSIKLIVDVVKQCNADLLHIEGGERINSIPKKATAIVAANNPPKSLNDNIKIKQIDTQTKHYKKISSDVIDFIYYLNNGIVEYDKSIKCVNTSINLAIVTTTIKGVYIELSARSMEDKKLELLKDQTIKQLKNYGFEVTTNGKYSAWEPEQNDFVNCVHNIYKKYNKDVKLEAIHAGLECAILKKRFPHIKPCSIGPNIYNPHSNREKCEIKSVNNIFDIIKEICDTV